MVQRTNAGSVRPGGGHESVGVMKGEVVSSILTGSTIAPLGTADRAPTIREGVELAEPPHMTCRIVRAGGPFGLASGVSAC